MKLLFLHGAPAQHDVPLVVQTSCYSHPEDLPLLEDFELTCSRSTLEARVGSPDRVQRRKVTSKVGLDRCLARWNLVPVPRDSCYTVDTEAAAPNEAAAAIVAHFSG